MTVKIFQINDYDFGRYVCLRCNEKRDEPNVHIGRRYLCAGCCRLSILENWGNEMNCEPCAKRGRGATVAVRIVEIVDDGKTRKSPMCTSCWREQGETAADAPTVAQAIEAQRADLSAPTALQKRCACGCGAIIKNAYWSYVKGHKTRAVVDRALPGLRPDLSAGAIPAAIEAEIAAYTARVEALRAALRTLRTLG